MVDQVVAKMKCQTTETQKYGKYESQKSHKVTLGAVYSNTGENKDFSDATPSGACWMQISNGVPAAEFFEPGEDYYVTFTKVPK